MPIRETDDLRESRPRSSSASSTRPFLPENSARNNIDPASQTLPLQAFLRVSRHVMALRGKPEEYRQGRINTDANISDSAEMKRSKISDLTSQIHPIASSSQNEAESHDSDPELYSSDEEGGITSDEEGDFKLISRDVTYGFPPNPHEADIETHPNHPDNYRENVLREGWRPNPPQTLSDYMLSYISPNRRKTNAILEVIDSERKSEQYMYRLNKRILSDIELSRLIAKDTCRDDIDKVKNDLYAEIDTKENDKLKALKKQIRENSQKSKEQKEDGLQQIREQENKLQGLKEQKKSELQRLKEENMQRFKEEKEKKEKILRKLQRREEQLEEIRKQKRSLKKTEEKDGSSQNNENIQKLKKEKINILYKIKIYKNVLQEIEQYEEKLQRIKQLEEKLQKLKEERNNLAKEIRGMFGQNQKDASSMHLKEIEVILKKHGKSSQWLRMNAVRFTGIRA